MKEFITRTTTAFFLLIGAYGLIKFVPPIYFSIILFILVSMGAVELVKLTNPGIYSRVIIFLNGLIIALSFVFNKPGPVLAAFLI